MKILSISKWDK